MTRLRATRLVWAVTCGSLLWVVLRWSRECTIGQFPPWLVFSSLFSCVYCCERQRVFLARPRSLRFRVSCSRRGFSRVLPARILSGGRVRLARFLSLWSVLFGLSLPVFRVTVMRPRCSIGFPAVLKWVACLRRRRSWRRRWRLWSRLWPVGIGWVAFRSCWGRRRGWIVRLLLACRCVLRPLWWRGLRLGGRARAL